MSGAMNAELRALEERFATFNFVELKCAWNYGIVPRLRELAADVAWPEVGALEQLRLDEFEAACDAVLAVFDTAKARNESTTTIPLIVRQEAYVYERINTLAEQLFERIEVYDRQKEQLLRAHKDFVLEKENLVVQFRGTLPSPRRSHRTSNGGRRRRQPPFTPRTQAAVDLIVIEFEMFLLNCSIGETQRRLEECTQSITSIVELLLDIQRRFVDKFRQREVQRQFEFQRLMRMSLWLVPMVQCFIRAITPYVCRAAARFNK